MNKEIKIDADNNINLEDFLIFFEKMEDYRNRTISGIIYICQDENISLKEFDNIFIDANKIKRYFYQSLIFASGSPVVEKTNTNIYLSFHESENITFLKISDFDPINID